MEKGLVGGAILYTDSSHVKAKAHKHKKTTVVAERTPKAYSEELDEAIERDRGEPGRKPFDKKDDDNIPPTREVQQSKSDPESGRLHKEAKPDGFHYSEHRTVDGKHNIAVNVRITPANVNDAEPAAEILKDIEKRWGSILSTWAGRGIPQRAGVPPACVSRDTAGSRLPEAYAQGGLFRKIPFHL